MKSNSRAREGIGGEGGAVAYVVRLSAFALQDEVGLADGVSLRVHLLPVQVHGHLFAPFNGHLRKRLLGYGQHSAGTAGAVVDQVSARLYFISHWQENKPGHELDHVARGEVLPGLLVVLLVELADEFLEYGAHSVVVQPFQSHGAIPIHDGPGTEIDGPVKEFLQEEAQGVRFHQGRNLIAELELVQHFLHVRRKAVQVRLKVGPQPLLPSNRSEVPKPKRGGVVEGFACGTSQGRVLIRDAGFVQVLLHSEHSVFGRFQYRIQSADNGHGQDDVPVLAADVDIPQHVIGDAPNETTNIEYAQAMLLLTLPYLRYGRFASKRSHLRSASLVVRHPTCLISEPGNSS